jgi:hypothetical protein
MPKFRFFAVAFAIAHAVSAFSQSSEKRDCATLGATLSYVEQVLANVEPVQAQRGLIMTSIAEFPLGSKLFLISDGKEFWMIRMEPEADIVRKLREEEKQCALPVSPAESAHRLAYKTQTRKLSRGLFIELQRSFSRAVSASAMSFGSQLPDTLEKGSPVYVHSSDYIVSYAENGIRLMEARSSTSDLDPSAIRQWCEKVKKTWDSTKASIH